MEDVGSSTWKKMNDYQERLFGGEKLSACEKNWQREYCKATAGQNSRKYTDGNNTVSARRNASDGVKAYLTVCLYAHCAYCN